MSKSRHTGRTTTYGDQTVASYPLHWPTGHPRTPVGERQIGRFDARGDGGLTLSQAIRRLMSQIGAFTRTGHNWRINPATVVVSSNVPSKLDGLPRSGANVTAIEDPGVAVYFHLDDQPYCLPCDRYSRVVQNAAAVAKYLEATRGIERWGVGDLRRQFAGFKALPDQSSEPGSLEQTAEMLLTAAKLTTHHIVAEVLSDGAVRDSVYRSAAMHSHPDRPGGSAEAFACVCRAMDLIRRHVGD